MATAATQLPTSALPDGHLWTQTYADDAGVDLDLATAAAEAAEEVAKAAEAAVKSTVESHVQPSTATDATLAPPEDTHALKRASSATASATDGTLHGDAPSTPPFQRSASAGAVLSTPPARSSTQTGPRPTFKKGAFDSFTSAQEAKPMQRVPLITAGMALARGVVLGPPLEGWSPMEAAISHFLRKTLGDGRIYANIQTQRAALDSLPYPTPKGVHIAKFHLPKRTDIYNSLIARSEALDKSRGWFTPKSLPSAPAPSSPKPTPTRTSSFSFPTLTRKNSAAPPNPADWVECEILEYHGSGKKWDGNGPTVLYIHGGAWIIGSPKAYRWISTRLAKELNARVIVVHYGLAPEAPFPAGIIDVVSTYAFLTLPASSDTPAHPLTPAPVGVAGCAVEKGVHFGGDSAGGNISLALLHLIALSQTPASVLPFTTSTLPEPVKLRKPASTFLMSPATELTLSNPDYQLNRFDFLPWAPLPDILVKQVHAYCTNAEIVTSVVSPGIYGWFGNPAVEGGRLDLGPILVQVGEAERLWGQGLTAALRLARLGHPTRVESYQNQPHVFQIVTSILNRPVGKRALESIFTHIRAAENGSGPPVTPVVPTPNGTDPVMQCFSVDPKGALIPTTTVALREHLGELRKRVLAHVGGKEPKSKKLIRRDSQIPRAEIWNGWLSEWYTDMSEAKWEEAEQYGIPDALKVLFME
ncbi:alpha/beta-hydrolase [Gonapodya prolifera JEL478]|uniref:Alpha/beta-hydrolase n=1 Tax=Gonapodya prolifera (strain JEL478) TaxID=1344416 RepID=A0A139AVU3_GONPJ|nr:alpha/beta-hydrolase [Gonapodya prolifera JEL478]|eukprot:KXS20595.1 alpha/beta-hydrolase [Gonapodya prolifera JEL478]